MLIVISILLIENFNQQDAVIDQRLLQQQEIDRLYPNGSNF
ncbi:hypothetical protein CWATWH8502_4962 [Crocosphaera watsonii WH 8502]|uniref:Uncharacterized protein n=1 Tax=Crocosphaera watsonii WH 8502 TaxID=423474 RepID=T2IH49_CROWT|nr:hypothetical protein CWATWH8502_4962 [Crocosphaera watsonii WH 8502]